MTESRILVVEDNETNLELMVYLLQAFDYLVLTARNGIEGLEIARAENPDMIICDVHLPGMDGYGVAQEVKADPALRDTPLVAVTAMAMVGDREKVLAAGFDYYISKPILPAEFLQQVDQILRQGEC